MCGAARCPSPCTLARTCRACLTCRQGLTVLQFVWLREIFVRIGEDRLAHLLKQADDLFDDVEIGSYPRFDTEEYRVKITVESRALERVDACVAFVIDALAPADIVRVGAAVAGRQAAD